ncbi:hypothetical protein BH20ACT15_BH20ACT15_12950 [soil metagenome]
MRQLLGVAAACALLAGCGGGGDSESSATDAGGPAAPTTPLSEEPSGTEASPEAEPADAPDTSSLPAQDEDAVRATVDSYIAELNGGDGGAVCSLFSPGDVPAERELPLRRGGCPASLRASIGFQRPGGRPAWRSTEVISVDAVSVGDDEARVTATVAHRFSDRSYTSVEEDVIYLEREPGGEWLLSKPSATLYRAVGYPEPPLRAFTPPR